MYGSNRLSHSGLQLGFLLGAICATVTMHSSAEAQQPRARIPVALKLVGDDGLTQALSSAIKDKLSVKKNLILDQNASISDFLISSESNVDWDTLGGNTVIIYRVRLTKAGRLIGEKVGVCFEKQADKCASDIVNQFGRIISVGG